MLENSLRFGIYTRHIGQLPPWGGGRTFVTRKDIPQGTPVLFGFADIMPAEHQVGTVRLCHNLGNIKTGGIDFDAVMDMLPMTMVLHNNDTAQHKELRRINCGPHLHGCGRKANISWLWVKVEAADLWYITYVTNRNVSAKEELRSDYNAGVNAAENDAYWCKYETLVARGVPAADIIRCNCTRGGCPNDYAADRRVLDPHLYQVGAEAAGGAAGGGGN